MLRIYGFLFGVVLGAQSVDRHVGAAACGKCHVREFAAQSRTGHARALSRAETHPLRGSWPLATTEARRTGGFRYRFDGLTLRVDNGNDVLAVPLEWAFGAGLQAVTFVSQVDAKSSVELYLTYFSKLRGFGPTPGHAALRPVNLAEAAGLFYPVGDAAAGIEGCFDCHSTGKLENGVRCEACHGAGSGHAASGGKQRLTNPGKMTAAEMNRFCGRCHRPPAADAAKVDWSYAWNVRHQPVYFSESACFLKSKGKLRCTTCHEPHEELATAASHYDAKCMGCHTTRAAACGDRNCAECHMPRVSPEPPLGFTNHWIGVYRGGAGLKPAPRNRR
jgi:hypothetical protein